MITQSLFEYTGCDYQGNVYPHGFFFDCVDGCNACTCNDGVISCTENTCGCTYNMYSKNFCCNIINKKRTKLGKLEFSSNAVA